MSRDIGSGSSSQDTGQEMCQICFSTSHSTPDCDVTKEGEMLKSANWAQEMLAARGVTALEVGKNEAETTFHLVDGEGTVLGELAITDELRLRGEDTAPTGKNAGFWSSEFTLMFETPDGTTLKLGTERPMDYVINDGLDFLKDAHARETGADRTPEALKRKEEQERARNAKTAEQMGLTPDELEGMMSGRRSLNKFFEKRGKPKDRRDISNLMDRWEGRSYSGNEDPENRYLSDEKFEEHFFGGLPEDARSQFGDEFRDVLPEYRRVAAKARDFKERRLAAEKGLSVEDWKILDGTSKALDRFALGLGSDRRLSFPLLFQGWRMRGLDDPTNKELEARLVKLLDQKERDELEELKQKIPQCREIEKRAAR
ncbi:MAG: hypothetical protein Q8N81_03045 [bacterium]|nr:hypothetical protein [bacterium]